VEAARWPIVFLAAIAGVDVEVAVRWLMLLMVLCLRPGRYRADGRGVAAELRQKTGM